MADNKNNESKEVIKLDFQTNANQASKEVNNLNVSIEQTTESVEDNTQAYKTFKTQLREANAELQKAVQIYGETSTEAINAAKGVAELRDSMQAASDLSEALNPDQKFKALGAATQVAATGIQGVTAGMALFGDQSEDTQAALLKVQAAMAFSDAISGLSELGDQWNLLKSTISQSSLATKANTAATGAAAIVQNLFTGSVDTTSTSFKGLKTAIAATGIGLLVVGVTALIANFDKVKKVVLDFVPGLAKVGEFVGDIVESITDFVGVTSEADRAVDAMIANADKSLAKNKKFLQEHGSQLDEYSKQKIEIVNEYNEALKEAGANQVALALEANRRLAAVDKARQDEIDKNRAEADEKEKARLEKLRKEEEERLKKAEEARIKAAEKRRQEAEDLALEQEEEQKRASGLTDTYFEDQEQKKLTHEAEMASIAAQQREIDYNNQKDIDAKAAAAKLENQNLLVSQGEQLIKNVAQLAGKNKAIQKAAIISDGAIALGKAGVNTAEAVTKDLAKGAPFSAPLVALDIAVGATSAAAIISSTAKALQAVGGGSIGSAPSTQSIPSGINGSPQTGFQASSENQIATSINSANKQPQIVKAFVVSSDVTTAQTLDAKLVGENSFGGATVKP